MMWVCPVHHLARLPSAGPWYREQVIRKRESAREGAGMVKDLGFRFQGLRREGEGMVRAPVRVYGSGLRVGRVQGLRFTV